MDPRAGRTRPDLAARIGCPSNRSVPLRGLHAPVRAYGPRRAREQWAAARLGHNTEASSDPTHEFPASDVPAKALATTKHVQSTPKSPATRTADRVAGG